jgi:hypothetical protein
VEKYIAYACEKSLRIIFAGDNIKFFEKKLLCVSIGPHVGLLSYRASPVIRLIELKTKLPER